MRRNVELPVAEDGTEKEEAGALARSSERVDQRRGEAVKGPGHLKCGS